MLFYTDECIPLEVIEALTSQGHEARSILDFVSPGSPDQLVATVAQRDGAILISHDKDFKQIASRQVNGHTTRFPQICVVRMECKPLRIKERIEKALSHVLLEYSERSEMRDKRLIMTVRTDNIVVSR